MKRIPACSIVDGGLPQRKKLPALAERIVRGGARDDQFTGRRPGADPGLSAGELTMTKRANPQGWPGSAVASIVAAFGAVFLAAMGVAHAAVLNRSDTGATVSAAAIETALSRSGLVARLRAGETLRIYGLTIAAKTPALAYISASSEFIIAAALEGELTAAGHEEPAQPGQMFALAVAPDAKPARESFDVKQFLAAPPRGIPAHVRSALENVAAEQADRVWWGSLQRTILNVQSPVPPLVEGVRRDYLLEPAMVRLRSEAGADPTRFALLTAQSFVAAMGRRDVDTVRALLHPTLFAGQGVGLNWLAKRHLFATQLARGPLAARMSGASVAVDADGRVIATGRSGQRWELLMSVLDAGVFVSAVEPR